MTGKRTDTPTMVSPRRAKAGPSHPLKALTSAVTPIGWAVIAFIIAGLVLAVTLEWVEALACALAGVVALGQQGQFRIGRRGQGKNVQHAFGVDLARFADELDVGRIALRLLSQAGRGPGMQAAAQIERKPQGKPARGFFNDVFHAYPCLPSLRRRGRKRRFPAGRHYLTCR